MSYTKHFIPLKTCETKNFNNSLLKKKSFDKLKLARQDKQNHFKMISPGSVR